MLIKVHKPSVRRKDMDSVLTCLINDNLAPGALSKQLSEEVADYLGLDGGLAVREYHRAIRLSFQALGLAAGARVGISPLAPRVYASVMAELSLVPVLIDVEADTACIDSTAARASAPMDAVVCHYSLGFAPDMERFEDLGIPIIEDLSEGLGANLGSRRGGSFGHYTVVGLEAADIVTSGGGAIVLGRTKREGAALRKVSEGLSSDQVLPDMNASLGLTQIKEIERFVSRRREMAGTYVRAVAQSKQRPLVQLREAENVYFSFPVRVDKGLKDIQAIARKKNIETAAAFAGSILADSGGREEGLPNAHGLLLRTLLFPLYPSLGRTHAEQVAKVLQALP